MPACGISKVLGAAALVVSAAGHSEVKLDELLKTKVAGGNVDLCTIEPGGGCAQFSVPPEFVDSIIAFVPGKLLKTTCKRKGYTAFLGSTTFPTNSPLGDLKVEIYGYHQAELLTAKVPNLGKITAELFEKKSSDGETLIV